MSKRIYLFRHGLTEAVKNQHDYGEHVLDAEILPEGIPEIERMAIFFSEIPDSLNYSSQLLRCRQTVEIIHRISGKDFLFDERLNEFTLGLSESTEAFYQRVTDFYNELQSKIWDNVLICTHSAVILALLKITTESPVPWLEMQPVLPGILVIIEGQSIRKINFASGLDPETLSI